MKTAKTELYYDFTGKNKVEIENNMAPLYIGNSESGQVEILSELSIHSFVPGAGIAEYFHVDEEGPTLKIVLENIPELAETFLSSGKSQVWIRVPKGTAVIAKAETLPIKAEGLQGSLVLHNENGPLKLEECEGHIHLQNENGPIKLTNCSGNFEIQLENGPLSGEKLSGENLEITSENGPVKIRQASFSRVKISNENGVIYYETLPLESGEMSFENENGIVNLVLPPEQNFELDAETNVGAISTSLGTVEDLGGGHKIIRQGEGGLQIKAKTENGVIKLGSGGQSEMNFVKMKIKELKGAIGAAVSEADKEKVQKALDSATAAVEKAIGSINEENIKEKVANALAKLKKTVEDFDFKETSDKVVKTVDQIGDEVTNTLKNVFRKVKEADGEEKPQHGHFSADSLKEYVNKAIENALAKVQGKGLSGGEKQEVDERSRSKILEMLESGKITAEEAERLLKAIGRE